MGIFSTMMWNAIHMATHGLTTVNKRVETLKSCRRHAKGVVTKVISPLRLRLRTARLHDFNVSTLLFTVVRPCVAMCIAFHIIVEKMPIRHLHYAI